MAEASPQSRSNGGLNDQTTRVAYIAARAHGVRVDDVPAWVADHLGIKITRRQIQDAVGPIRAESAHKQRRGRKGVPRLVKREPILHEGLVVDEAKLGLRRVLFRLANEGWPQPALLQDLEGLAGVRQVLEVDSTRELIIVALVVSLEDADDLRAQIEERAPGRPVRRDFISYESTAAAAATWLRLAQRTIEASRE